MSSEQRKQTILAVDDTPENIDLIKGVLSSDYEIKVAINGEIALRIAAALHPDLILLDIMMPEIDGFEVCTQLKKNEITRNIPVIFLTAKNSISDETKGLSLGAVDYITKPISPPILQARVKNHLALMSAYRQLESQNLALIEASNLREDVQRITQHDLKSPLNVIVNIPVLLKMDDNLTDSQREQLGMIESSGYLMLDMINRSLDLYKMETGSYQYIPRIVNLIPILKRVFTDCAKLVIDKSVSLVLLTNGKPVAEGEEFRVEGEELLCYTLFSNLVKNAVEASMQSGEEVSVALSKDGSAYAHIAIHNKGNVPESMRSTFFDKYTTAGKSRGTGLGTYSAALSARTQGGEITLHSTEQDGTTLLVKLKTAD